MGKGCITVTKYFLFLFNLLFFVSNWVDFLKLDGYTVAPAPSCCLHSFMLFIHLEKLSHLLRSSGARKLPLSCITTNR